MIISTIVDLQRAGRGAGYTMSEGPKPGERVSLTDPAVRRELADVYGDTEELDRMVRAFSEQAGLSYSDGLEAVRRLRTRAAEIDEYRGRSDVDRASLELHELAVARSRTTGRSYRECVYELHAEGR